MLYLGNELIVHQTVTVAVCVVIRTLICRDLILSDNLVLNTSPSKSSETSLVLNGFLPLFLEFQAALVFRAHVILCCQFTTLEGGRREVRNYASSIALS